MALTMEEIRSRLSSIEGEAQMYVDFGPDEVPLLVELLDDEEAWMASRAVYALTRVDSPEALAAVEEAADSDREEVRLAVAVSAKILPTEAADRILSKLLQDRELGVRKFAIDSVKPDSDERVREMVKEMTQANDEIIRGRARARERDLGG